VRRAWIAALWLATSCTPSEHREARDTYNHGAELLAKGDFEGAEKAFLDSRSNAGVDPELRFRSAYDLGCAYAAHAAKARAGEDADLTAALDLEEQAVSWFTQASHQRKGDRDTLENLAIARTRAQAMKDELLRDQNTLEGQLDSVIEEQREVVDGARSAWVQIKQTGGADPVAQQKPLIALADMERGVSAEAGVIGDLADDEVDQIGKKPEDKREDKEKVRLVQLKNLDVYLTQARSRVAEARRKLQDLAAEDGLARCEAAMIALKRAREQLLDPTAILQAVGGEEVDLIRETRAVSEATAPKLLANSDQKPVIPVWMQPAALAERQTGLRDRIDEVRARLSAITDHADKPGDNGEPPKMTEEQAKELERFTRATPFVTEASAAMERAQHQLADGKLDDAGGTEREAVIAIGEAVEEFADLKQTIELATNTQKELTALVTPGATQLEPKERAEQAKQDLARNLARLPKIKTLLAEQAAKIDAEQKQAEQKAAAPAQGAQGSGTPPPPSPEDLKKHFDELRQQLAAAEPLRADAEKAIAELETAIAKNTDPLAPSKTAQAKLEELRELFFDLIEHLQDLIRKQGETRDQTTTANADDDFTRAPKLPGLVTREDEHAQMAKAIHDVLAKQADAAGKTAGAQPPGPHAQQGPDPKTLASAASEVQLAQNSMADAKTGLGKAQAATNQSVSLKPAVDAEAKAIEHLQAALKLLQPPSKNKKKKDKQQQQSQSDKPDQSKSGAGQSANDEDARRQRENAEKNDSKNKDPVEQDW